MYEKGAFAEAVFDQNTKEEIIESLKEGTPDKTDMKNWGLTPAQWREELELALELMEVYD